MDKFHIGAWNIRGLNDSLKIEAVNTHSRVNSIAIMGILETRIREKNINTLTQFDQH